MAKGKKRERREWVMVSSFSLSMDAVDFSSSSGHYPILKIFRGEEELDIFSCLA
jgi:hypothetical protein